MTQIVLCLYYKTHKCHKCSFSLIFFFFDARSLSQSISPLIFCVCYKKGLVIVNIKAQEERQVVVVALFISCNLSWYVTK